jgi:hypothetical protein
MPTNSSSNTLFDVADGVATLSSALFRARMLATPPIVGAQRKKLIAIEIALDTLSNDIRGQAISALVNLTAPERATLAAATDKAKSFLARLAKIEKILGAVTAVLGLVLSITSGNLSAILTSARAVQTAVGSAQGN